MTSGESKKFFFLLMFILLVIFAAIFNYNKSLNNISNNLILRILDEKANENINDFQKEIDMRVNLLRIIASAKNDVDCNKFFSKIDFSEIENENLYEKDFYVSEPFSENGNKYISITTIANNLVVRGTCAIKSFQNIFHTQKYESVYITTNAGQIIFSQGNDSDLPNFNEIIYQLKNNLSRFMEYELDSQLKILNYRPLGINNWYIFCSVPKKIVFEQSKNIFANTFNLLLIIFGSVLIFIFYIVLSDKKHINDVKKVNRQLNVVTENIPGAVQSRLNDSNFTLTYLSEGFLRITGYDREQIHNFFDDKYISLIYFDDIQRVKENLAEQLSFDRYFQLEYRLVKKNGQIIWVIERGQIVENLIHSVVIDITELKNIWDELKNNEEKYKLIAEESESIVFEFDIKNGVVHSCENLKKILGIDLVIKNFPHDISELVFSEDIQILSGLLNNIHDEVSECELRLKNKNDKFVWCRLTIIFDEKKSPIKALGKLENINAWKLEQENLRIDAQTDLLTGLYNKITAEKLIDEYLNGDGKNKISAIIAIDIDNFKSVNDNLGHLIGDKVLVEIAQKLKTLFRYTDIIGRFGGDEFVVFLKDLSPEQKDFKKIANDILNSLRAKIENNEYCKISASVGIAIYPKNGLNFQQLYKNADDALYRAKKSGKDSWKLF